MPIDCIWREVASVVFWKIRSLSTSSECFGSKRKVTVPHVAFGSGMTAHTPAHEGTRGKGPWCSRASVTVLPGHGSGVGAVVCVRPGSQSGTVVRVAERSVAAVAPVQGPSQEQPGGGPGGKPTGSRCVAWTEEAGGLVVRTEAGGRISERPLTSQRTPAFGAWKRGEPCTQQQGPGRAAGPTWLVVCCLSWVTT